MPRDPLGAELPHQTEAVDRDDGVDIGGPACVAVGAVPPVAPYATPASASVKGARRGGSPQPATEIIRSENRASTDSSDRCRERSVPGELTLSPQIVSV